MIIKIIVGEYTLTLEETGIFVTAENGEGMEIGEVEFEKMLREYWEENF